ncbi:hypothetical protein GT347_13800 [Xylophilus rhododendri]|uniref:Uncharacterized protein n=1 Tax=Xylophilus rhododendri TaxID=2697032 RepID=A0A857J564_9BURK|nr:hypothetical protein [Xylophilus rhododendri]QHI98966.1 hypothetical protein GT347_13800 [Xylophilus rhododendri]
MSDSLTDPATDPPLAASPLIGRPHARRLRDIYRSAGWPSQDLVEVELLSAGLVQQLHDSHGRMSLRVTEQGLALMARSLAGNRAALSSHQALEEQVARAMQRAGRIVWRGLALRAQVPCDAPAAGADAAQLEDADAPRPSRWCIAKPDVFSIRNTSVEAYLAPVVHEIKVRRSDLLSDLRNPAKRAAYLDVSSECWYVLGPDGHGRPIGSAEEIPPECGVMLAEGDPARPRLTVARPAPRRARTLPFGLWLALAKATPLPVLGDDDQALLSPCEDDPAASS